MRKQEGNPGTDPALLRNANDAVASEPVRLLAQQPTNLAAASGRFLPGFEKRSDYHSRTRDDRQAGECDSSLSFAHPAYRGNQHAILDG